MMQTDIDLAGDKLQRHFEKNYAVEHWVAWFFVRRHRFLKPFQEAIKEPDLFLVCTSAIQHVNLADDATSRS